MIVNHIITIPHWREVKVKGKLSLSLMNQASRHEDVFGSGGIAIASLTTSIDGCEWSDSCPGHFTTSTHWIGGQVGSRAGLDTEERNLACRQLNIGRPARYSTYWVIPPPCFTVQVKRNNYRIVSFLGETVTIHQFRCIAPVPQYWWKWHSKLSRLI